MLLGVVVWLLVDRGSGDGDSAGSRPERVDQTRSREPARTVPGKPALDSPRYRKLAERAGRDGVVPVIVRLDAPDPSEANSDDEQTKRRAAIADRRDALLRQLRGTRYTNFRAFTVVPFVSLHASLEALDVLSRSPDVLDMREDTPVATPEGRESADPSTKPLRAR
jgi:hypothetical protein